MIRLMIIAAALALLALPVVVGGEETPIPPELHWTPTPPARALVNADQLMDLLVKKGVLTPAEQAQIKQPATAGSTRDYTEMDRNDAMGIVSQP
jgi:hypothetical protein